MAKIVKGTSNVFTTPDIAEKTANGIADAHSLYNEIGRKVVKAMKDVIKNDITYNAEFNGKRSNFAQIKSELEVVVMSVEQFQGIMGYSDEAINNIRNNKKIAEAPVTIGLLVADMTGDEMVIHESYKLTENGFEKVDREITNPRLDQEFPTEEGIFKDNFTTL